MSYPLNYPVPQYADVKIFNAGETKGTQSWIKPQGASFVWFTLIGAGGGGDGVTGGGGSGAVTNCLVPAFLIPDELQIQVGVGGVSGSTGTNTVINYVSNSTYNLLTANAGSNGSSGAGGAASASNYFSAMGFFQSTAGQNGSTTILSPSTSTFLSGGAATSGVANYGYSLASDGDGFFQMQPIIVGVGGAGTSTDNLKAGIGCGGAKGSANGGAGGDGLIVIISW